MGLSIGYAGVGYITLSATLLANVIAQDYLSGTGPNGSLSLTVNITSTSLKSPLSVLDSPSLEILHLHSNTNPASSDPSQINSNDKRSHASYTPISNCPTTYTTYAWCTDYISPQAYAFICTAPVAAPIPPVIIRNACPSPEQICVGSQTPWNNGSSNGVSRAWCVVTDHFTSIGATTGDVWSPSGGGSAGSYIAGFMKDGGDGNSNRSFAIEALITDLSNTTSLVAQSIVLQAQAQNDQGTWRTVLPPPSPPLVDDGGGGSAGIVFGGRGSCVRCSSASLDPVPDGTERVKVDVVLANSTTRGRLWLASFEVESDEDEDGDDVDNTGL